MPQNRYGQKKTGFSGNLGFCDPLFCLFYLFCLFVLFLCPIWGVHCPSAWASEESAASGSALRQEVRQCIKNLDAESYFLRQQARQRLEQMLGQPDIAPVAAQEIRRWGAGPVVSAEVRHVLETLCRRFPEAFSQANSGGDGTFGEDKGSRSGGQPSPSPSGIVDGASQSVPPPSPGQIETLLQQLESDSYAQRRWAAEQLRTYLDRPEWAGVILRVFRTRLARGEISADLRRWMDPLWERAWGAWLASGLPGTDLPPAQPEEVQRYVEILARPIPEGSPEGWQSVRQAQRQLRMLLVRDDQVKGIREAIERRLASGGLSPEVEARLMELADLCRPAMVAEFWQQGQHRGIQHLLVGVPSQVSGAPRPSHFDYIDDTRAHCVSGSNLSPGDYPVGVAIPHPHQADAFFHLVNLPTPRRRMAYEYLVQRDVRQRLAEITQRTCQYYLRRRQPLSVPEILVLAQLDPKQVSRFASEFLRLLPDEPIEEAAWDSERLGRKQREAVRLAAQEPMEVPGGPVGRPSRHGLLCMILAEHGTKEAAPGLVEALAKGHILPPTPEAPYAWGWIAALAIARRDPWPEVDDWLLSVIPRTDLLILPDQRLQSAEIFPHPPQLGASAAALLLDRHGHLDASAFSMRNKLLGPADSPVLGRYKVSGFRFLSPKAAEEFLQWWKTRQVLRNSAG